MTDITYHETCRAGGGALKDIISLGDLALSGFVDNPTDEVLRAPLTLSIADTSGLVQLRHTVPSDLMFREYWYRSGTNASMIEHLKTLAQKALRFVAIRSDDIVVDIGCNDGTLLGAFPFDLVRVGFDPAEIVPKNVNHFVNDYFSAEKYPLKIRPKIITSIAMFYDIEEPVKFAAEVAQLLADDGVWVIEMHHLGAMVDMNGFDAICHEHLCYYTMTSLEYVLDQVDLKVIAVETNQVNGGSFRVYVKKNRRDLLISRSVRYFRGQEKRIDLEGFVKGVDLNRQTNQHVLHLLKKEGKVVHGYGASTKGNTMLQYYGVNSDLLPVVGEVSQMKFGKYTAATGIPIVSECDSLAASPDYLYVLPYHFTPFFLKKCEQSLKSGLRFIVPMPYPHFVGLNT